MCPVLQDLDSWITVHGNSIEQQLVGDKLADIERHKLSQKALALSSIKATAPITCQREQTRPENLATLETGTHKALEPTK